MPARCNAWPIAQTLHPRFPNRRFAPELPQMQHMQRMAFYLRTIYRMPKNRRYRRMSGNRALCVACVAPLL